MSYELIVATSSTRGIGYEGKIPWWIPADLRHFREITTQGSGPNLVVMGRKTWESIHPDKRPLKGRTNIVLSRTLPLDIHPEVRVFRSFSSMHEFLGGLPLEGRRFVIGGEEIYRHFLAETEVAKIHMTRVYNVESKEVIPCDAHFPDFPNFYLADVSTRHTDEASKLDYEYRTYHRSPTLPEADNYLALVHDVLHYGTPRTDRTGVGTLSQFGRHMRFDLTKGFPLLTTKRMFLRGIIEELLWFLRGETDAETLQRKRVHIWDGNSSREYLDSIGLEDNREGDCGPIYGFAFRHFGAEYRDCDTDYTGQGYDQVAEVLRLIREDPTSRRILISLWNPCDLGKVALPPCHVLYQFYVDGEYLSCSMYQRSGDVGLGVPFNIASASLMTHLFAHLTGKRAREFVYTIGDAHIYNDHVEALHQQLDRTPFPFPRVTIQDRGQQTVEDFRVEDVLLQGYESHSSIQMEMAV